MGQATVDLPDPLQTPPVSTANTDDLLAQLAGEEIDRLLAEADTGAPPVTPSSTASNEPAPKTADPVSTSSAVAGVAKPPVAQNAGVSSAELDDLLGQLDVSSQPPENMGTLPVSAATASATPSASSPALTPAEDSPEHPVAAELDEDARMSAGPGAFNAPVIATSKADATEFVPKPMIRSTRLPIYFRPLEWLNAPLACCPDQVRDTIGKIAILTTVNALSVLTYVLLFRGH